MGCNLASEIRVPFLADEFLSSLFCFSTGPMDRANVPARLVFCQHHQFDTRAVDLAVLETSGRLTSRCRPCDIPLLSDYHGRALGFRRAGELNVFLQMMSLVLGASLGYAIF